MLKMIYIHRCKADRPRLNSFNRSVKNQKLGCQFPLVGMDESAIPMHMLYNLYQLKHQNQIYQSWRFSFSAFVEGIRRTSQVSTGLVRRDHPLVYSKPQISSHGENYTVACRLHRRKGRRPHVMNSIHKSSVCKWTRITGSKQTANTLISEYMKSDVLKCKMLR